MTLAVHKIAWNSKGWKSFDENEFSRNLGKSSIGFVKTFGYGHEWWNFYEGFDKEHYFGYFYGKEEAKIKSPITVLFISQNPENKKWYLVGAYIDAEISPEGFDTGKRLNELIPQNAVEKIKEYVKQHFDELSNEFKEYYNGLVSNKHFFISSLKVKKKNAILFREPIKIEYPIGRSFANNQVMFKLKTLRLHKKFFEEVINKLIERMESAKDEEKKVIQKLIERIEENVFSSQDTTDAQKISANPEMMKIFAKIERILRKKGAVILYGPPGTGKTYTALEFVNYRKKQGKVEFEIITFHQNYDYDDFVIGIRPKVRNGKLMYEVEEGILLKFVREAERNPEKEYYLIIDEINRGDISRVFGEVITLIEMDKRDEEIQLPYGNKKLKLPKNLYIIGTMNSTDRSIALIDFALRRRFGFIRLDPDYDVLHKRLKEKIGKDAETVVRFLKKLNQKIQEKKGKDFAIGHSFFMNVDKKEDLVYVWNYEIIPLLEEYFYLETNILLDEVLNKKFRNKESEKEIRKYDESEVEMLLDEMKKYAQ